MRDPRHPSTAAAGNSSREPIPETRPNLFWRIAAVFAAGFLIWLFIIWLSGTLFGPDYTTAGRVLNAVVASALTIPLVVLARRFLDRRPWSGLRLTSLRSGWRPLLLGMAGWLIPAGIGAALCVALGWSEITLLASIPEVVLTTAVLLVLVFLYEALPEELVFRGYLYRNLSAAIAPWLAMLGQAVLFCLFGSVLWAVIGGGTVAPERVFLFFGMGLVLGCIRVITGNVWACIGFHLAFQTAAQLLLGSNLERFAVSHPEAVQVLVFVPPFVFSVLLIGLAQRGQVNWSEREPDRRPEHWTSVSRSLRAAREQRP